MTTIETGGSSSISAETVHLEAAVRRSFGRAMLRHKLLRQPIWVDNGDGVPTRVEPDDIVTGLSPSEEAEEIRTSGGGTWFSE